MFNNLIESASHAKELKRRGSFLLITTATYAVLLVLAGVASIYAYDAHLEVPTDELQITFVPLAPEPQPPQVTIRDTAPRPRDTSSPDRPVTVPERTVLLDSTSNPNNVPTTISTAAQPIPPAPPGAVLSNRNVDPDVAVGSRTGVPLGSGSAPTVSVTEPPPPPPAPKPTPPAVLKISRVLNSQAIELPKPTYPPMARTIRLQGVVAVQVLIDENGKVISAKAVSGHPILVPEALRAALRARFSPTTIGDHAVKVSGVITYNFVMQ